MDMLLMFVPLLTSIFVIIVPGVALYVLWRALLAFERITTAVEQIARNTRPPRS
jgi:hypothetical protein